ncbi:gluconate 2-dehydrogenase subunit 3 family protein [Parahaliea mediterranea]|uniref:Gluconate 2-dehydrogenase subunit 3 family protein n=1 Tax=Parahaliea mediterranea TaxID=651086 RepID=A0A939DC97_9GAMM|nr:gluconate 2-dehydrogenase subunit 3 family protein [Parahaliea mediterranea]MBN7795578.1 gluconate 2-dehydrogenase subunit 3 family protein [Parahaliea mediterranea]
MSSSGWAPAAATRRRFLQGSALALGFVAAGGARIVATPAEARARGLPLTVLDEAEAAALEVVVEALVPGARQAGIAHFVDQQLGAAAEDNLLMLKYLGFDPAGHAGFYREALSNIERFSRAHFDSPAAGLAPERAERLVAAMAGDDIPDWTGAPASLCHFALRADGVDVVYGTAAGMTALGMPAITHIEAPSPW